MKRALVFLCLCGLVPAAGMAQETRESHGQGYFFFAPGAAVSTRGGSLALAHFGSGLEAKIYKGLGIGAEIGYMAPFRYLNEGIGIASLNGLYMFSGSGSRRVVPFVTGGYSLAFRNGFAGAVNFGGGIHYWFGRRWGLRFEFRDHVNPNIWSDHLVGGRIGFEIR